MKHEWLAAVARSEGSIPGYFGSKGTADILWSIIRHNKARLAVFFYRETYNAAGVTNFPGYHFGQLTFLVDPALWKAVFR